MKNNFLRFIGWIALSFLFALTFCLLAIAGVEDPISIPDFFTQLWQLIGSAKGATGLTVALIVTQGAMLFFRTELASFAGKWKLTAVLFLSLVAGVVTLKISGASLGAAIFNSATLTAVQVFAHQLIKQFSEKSA